MDLPVKIKAIAKSFPGTRLIPYSAHMKRYGLRYREMVSFTGSEDACSIYNRSSDNYIIYYNDVDHARNASKRYRWNIAHELGHIALGHHRDYPEARLMRSELSSQTYKELEQEADMFAAYILVPHIILQCLGIQGHEELSSLCGISSAASGVRKKEFDLWRRRHKGEQYDFDILNLYAPFVESNELSKRISTWLNKYRRCNYCSALVAVHHSYCRVCGSAAWTKYVTEVPPMKYSGIEIDDQGRALECPICKNTELSEDGGFCMICGESIINFCSDDNPFGGCDYRLPLSGRARFCPHCGQKSTFFARGILKAWNQEEKKTEFVGLDDDNDKLPF